jgi:hypothetical protein
MPCHARRPRRRRGACSGFRAGCGAYLSCVRVMGHGCSCSCRTGEGSGASRRWPGSRAPPLPRRGATVRGTELPGPFLSSCPASYAISLASAVGISPRRQMRSPDPRMTPGPNLAEAGTGGLQCVRCTPALSCRSAEGVYRVGSASGCEVR